MKRDGGTQIPHYPLPEGFNFVLFKSGDEKDWADIETSVLEFDTVEKAQAYFAIDFLPHLKELRKRCLFIENAEGLKVATLTIWWVYSGNRRDPWIHWVSVRPEYQGLGLGKAIVSEGLKRGITIEGDNDFYLHTQTWSYSAIGIYQWAGFHITREQGLSGKPNNNVDKAIEEMKGYLK